MHSALFAPLFTLSLLFGMLLCLEVGRRIGLRCRAKAADGTVAGSGAMEGAVFALLGLLVAFSFSGAATRWRGYGVCLPYDVNVWMTSPDVSTSA
jgi:hypothetical protein